MPPHIVKERYDAAATTRIHSIADYNDDATTTSPLSLVVDTPMQLTNDGLGDNTDLTYLHPTIPFLWNTSTNRLDFSALKLGDKFHLRLDITLNVLSTNTDLLVGLDLGIGDTPFHLNFAREVFKSTGAYEILEEVTLYMGASGVVRDNPAEITATTDKNSTIIVNGFALFVN